MFCFFLMECCLHRRGTLSVMRTGRDLSLQGRKILKQYWIEFSAQDYEWQEGEHAGSPLHRNIEDVLLLQSKRDWDSSTSLGMTDGVKKRANHRLRCMWEWRAVMRTGLDLSLQGNLGTDNYNRWQMVWICPCNRKRGGDDGMYLVCLKFLDSLNKNYYIVFSLRGRVKFLTGGYSPRAKLRFFKYCFANIV